MTSIGGSLTEKIAVEVGHFIYILFGAGLTCDVIEGTRVQYLLKIIQMLESVFHTWFSVFPPNFAQVNFRVC